MSLRLVPITRDAAREWIKATHRHLGSPRVEVLRVACERDGVVVGVAIAGRPVARALADGLTLEISRVAVIDGVPNACSMLYSALARAARALGWRKIITYTREDEPGTSLRASGWDRVAVTRGGEWSCPSRPRKKAVQPCRKVRWEREL